MGPFIEEKMSYTLKALTYAVFILAATGFYTTCNGQARLQVTVKNFKDSGGSVRVGLFNNSKDFLKKGLDGKVAPFRADSVTVVFEGLEPGEYAVSVFHDRNDNGKLDTNVVGIPREGFAFGNNAMGLFGPPSFDKAKVTLKREDITQVLRLKHF